VRLWGIAARLIGFEVGDSSDRRGGRRGGGGSPFCFDCCLTLNKDTLSFRRRGGINLRGVDLLRNVCCFIFVIPIPFVLIIDVDFIFLILFLVVLVMDGNTIWN
jgi:hypothetical protein